MTNTTEEVLVRIGNVAHQMAGSLNMHGEFAAAHVNAIDADLAELRERFTALETQGLRGTLAGNPLTIPFEAALKMLAAERDSLRDELTDAETEAAKLLEYARTVKGSRDVHSVYEVLDLLARNEDQETIKRLRAELAAAQLGWA